MTAVTVSCGGTESEVGAWDVRETEKQVVFELVEKPKGMAVTSLWFDRLVCRKDNACPHHLTDWGDGDYTVYPERSGIPFHFSPVAHQMQMLAA